MAAPVTSPPVAADPEHARLATWLASRHRVVAVTGAGVSTASGIPDYRDADGQWKRAQPVTHQAFVGSAAVRRRYWARSHAGWPHFAAARPNAAHAALAALERRGVVQSVITQNVDGLHQRAGSRHVIDLHGRLDRVECLACARSYARDVVQQWLSAANPGWDAYSDAIAPDGDADVEGVDFDTFQIPACPHCGGMLKPDVVFYGGSVPEATRSAATQAVEDADGVLVVGSSLMVWSSFRLVRMAHAREIPVTAVNDGRTRADDLLAIKCRGDCALVLDAIVQRLPDAPP